MLRKLLTQNQLGKYLDMQVQPKHIKYCKYEILHVSGTGGGNMAGHRPPHTNLEESRRLSM